IEAYVEFSLHVAEDVTLVEVPSLHVAVAVYEDELLSFTDAAPLIVRLERVIVAAGRSVESPGKVSAVISVRLLNPSPSESSGSTLVNLVAMATPDPSERSASP
ncbi:MAG: hypothetical protein ACM31N_09215, partial [Deltaproteobacteria bacterium]